MTAAKPTSEAFPSVNKRAFSEHPSLPYVAVKGGCELRSCFTCRHYRRYGELGRYDESGKEYLEWECYEANLAFGGTKRAAMALAVDQARTCRHYRHI